ncbi:MAG: hypothetical protein WBC93_00260 [Sulfitobacter sp.]
MTEIIMIGGGITGLSAAAFSEERYGLPPIFALRVTGQPMAANAASVSALSPTRLRQ